MLDLNEKTAVLFEKVAALSFRIRKILESGGFSVAEASNDKALIGVLGAKAEEAALVILDLEMDEGRAMELIAETRSIAKNAPLIVLTAGGDKESFLEAILKGATDFVIKPFADQTLLAKADKYLSSGESGGMEIVTVDLPHFLSGELRKAEKGKYPLSLMFLNFEKSGGPRDADINKLLFNSIKQMFWETDMFAPFAADYYLGVFPFCDEKNTAVVSAKISAKFEELKKKNTALAPYAMAAVFVSYPYDTAEKAKVFELLKERIKQQYKDIQLG